VAQQRILVVDDDKFNAALMREICENAGYLVVEAHDGHQALALTLQESYDLILLDIMMGSKDGFQVCRELRAREETAETPIILVTAVDDLDSKVRGIEMGADDFVTKPFRLFDLQTRISSALDARRYRMAHEDSPESGQEATPGRPFRVGGFRQLRWDLEHEYNRAVRYHHPLACALVLVDRFEALYTEQKKKEAAGLIAAVVTGLQRGLRLVDRIYRIEDDVFIVLLPETTADQARIPVERIHEGLREPTASTTGPVTLTTALIDIPNQDISSARDMLRALTELLGSVRPGAGDQLIEPDGGQHG
jgi:PleD family two-component response regulator